LAIRFAVLATCIALPGFAVAGSPTDWVQGTVLEVKNSLAIQDSGTELTPEQVLEISRVLGNRFSFREMARLALGRHWQQLSAQERTEFVRLFRGLMERSHLWKLSAHAGVEQRYVGERIEGDRAVVRALVQADDGELPVDYFLIRNNGSWKMCDLTIDGVKLSATYRSEFNRVISKSSYKELVRKMSAKLEEVAMETSSQR
jgi:phospholipid transport system substrate-binding protein